MRAQWMFASFRLISNFESQFNMLLKRRRAIEWGTSYKLRGWGEFNNWIIIGIKMRTRFFFSFNSIRLPTHNYSSPSCIDARPINNIGKCHCTMRDSIGDWNKWNAWKIELKILLTELENGIFSECACQKQNEIKRFGRENLEITLANRRIL